MRQARRVRELRSRRRNATEPWPYDVYKAGEQTDVVELLRWEDADGHVHAGSPELVEMHVLDRRRLDQLETRPDADFPDERVAASPRRRTRRVIGSFDDIVPFLHRQLRASLRTTLEPRTTEEFVGSDRTFSGYVAVRDDYDLRSNRACFSLSLRVRHARRVSTKDQPQPVALVPDPSAAAVVVKRLVMAPSIVGPERSWRIHY